MKVEIRKYFNDTFYCLYDVSHNASDFLGIALDLEKAREYKKQIEKSCNTYEVIE